MRKITIDKLSQAQLSEVAEIFWRDDLTKEQMTEKIKRIIKN